MKTVLIEGQEYQVPDEAKWIAQTYYGDWLYFAEEPFISDISMVWSYWCGTLCGQVAASDYKNVEWKKTLKPVEEYMRKDIAATKADHLQVGGAATVFDVVTCSSNSTMRVALELVSKDPEPRTYHSLLSEIQEELAEDGESEWDQEELIEALGRDNLRNKLMGLAVAAKAVWTRRMVPPPADAPPGRAEYIYVFTRA